VNFKMKYPIIPLYLPSKTKRRSGITANKIKFMVAHDTGNPNSTARGNVKYYIDSANQMEASAHIFVDDKEIIECVPLLTDKPEKAWHVLYNVQTDNKLFGCDANDAAGGVEYCYGNNINSNEAYKRFIWVLAYSFFKFNLQPTELTGHHILDPKRKIDPENGLSKSGRSFEQLKKDVMQEYSDCLICEEDEDNMPLPLNDYEWKMLNGIWSQRYNKGEITDWKWIDKIRCKQLTAGELAFLNSVIAAKKECLSVEAESEGMQ